MQFTKFQIKNFRGIRDVTIDLERNPQASVYTIVGLNESGKSTVLEALSQMGRKVMNLSAHDPAKSGNSIKQYQSFIPVSQRHNFTGEIQLESTLRFSQDDKEAMRQFLLTDLGVVPCSLPDRVKIRKKIEYKASNHESTTNLWNLDPIVKKRRGRKSQELSTLLGESAWIKLADFIEATMLPHILYFRSEVFDFPNKIIIWIPERAQKEEAKREVGRSEINQFYRDVIEDILHAIDPSMTIQEHLVSRKKSVKERDGQNLASLLQQMSSHVTATVMAHWERIFQRRLHDKRVVVSCDFDETGGIYLQFKINDGQQLFDISDRSAGFRWFFSFIVLTQYRGKKADSALFLYDEPASNLHPSAQKQLIDCFRAMPEHFKAVYTTHSHYLINPEWLDATFVAQNAALSTDGFSLEFDSTTTDIRLTPYRKFVSDNPSQVSYFQPVLDVLQYSPSKLDPVNPCVLVEGKGDYYALRYLLTICCNKSLNYDLVPCGGSGTVDQLIALYAGWGKDFLVLLDSDAAGTAEKQRYLDKFGSLVRDRIIVYGDIESDWNGFAIEKVVGRSDLEAIHGTVFPGKRYNKKQLSIAIQELLIRRQAVKLTQTTQDNLRKIDSYLFSLIATETHEFAVPA